MNYAEAEFDANSEDVLPGHCLRRQWLPMTIAAALIASGVILAVVLSRKGDGTRTRPVDDVTTVRLETNPVVIPPKPQPQPDLTEVVNPENAPPEKHEEAGDPITTRLTGDDGSWGISPPGGHGVKPISIPASPAAIWTQYGKSAADRIAGSLRSHRRLKHATLSVTAHLWIDSTGRVTRAETQTSGDAAVDAMLRDEVLTGLQLSGPPPAGMQMPVNLQVNARRPE